MKRSWLWIVASVLLAVLAGVLAIVTLNRAVGGTTDQPAAEGPKRQVVVARQAIAAGTEIRGDSVLVEERDQIPSGAVVRVPDVLGLITLRDFAQGEVLLMQDLAPVDFTEAITLTRNLHILLEDKIAVALPADDVLSKWGAVLPGDSVDVLFTMDMILETPMLLDEIITLEGDFQRVERDQSMDQATVLALQDLEVLQIIEEPQVQVTQEGDEPPPAELPRRAMILKIDPQDAVILKYLRDTATKIDVALRSPINDALFEVESVNINYLMLRYGIAVPQPLE
jgi:Flp pilus assembly protein CpaB